MRLPGGSHLAASRAGGQQEPRHQQQTFSKDSADSTRLSPAPKLLPKLISCSLLAPGKIYTHTYPSSPFMPVHYLLRPGVDCTPLGWNSSSFSLAAVRGCEAREQADRLNKPRDSVFGHCVRFPIRCSVTEVSIERHGITYTGQLSSH